MRGPSFNGPIDEMGRTALLCSVALCAVTLCIGVDATTPNTNDVTTTETNADGAATTESNTGSSKPCKGFKPSCNSSGMVGFGEPAIMDIGDFSPAKVCGWSCLCPPSSCSCVHDTDRKTTEYQCRCQEGGRELVPVSTQFRGMSSKCFAAVKKQQEAFEQGFRRQWAG